MTLTAGKQYMRLLVDETKVNHMDLINNKNISNILDYRNLWEGINRETRDDGQHDKSEITLHIINKSN